MMRTLLTIFAWTTFCISLNAQEATMKEIEVEIPTYEFSDPDPLPMLGTQSELYPYFKFSTYSNHSVSKKWKVVVLENDYLKVEILPEVGGKIWGITEKQTKYDIIYKNEALKFRNIATRGPWSSGGIEFNFGFFGHTPSAATPVNYKLEKRDNGDVVCWLGSTDLPSSSDWRVSLILPADKAYLKIEYTWTNTNAYTHPYYYWSNAAVRATDDLAFYYPGTHQIGHGGDAHLFPTDEQGRDLSFYKNNAFGGNKSYHIVGDNKPYKAVYWADKKIGVGSLADKFNILGKKLWIWSMAPAGAIWENLLTDKNGQYIEIQSGRLYNQASPESGLYTPYAQLTLNPYQQDTWCEYWYPVIGTGGVSEASKEGVMYVDKSEKSRLKLNLMALSKLAGEIIAKDNKGKYWKQGVVLKPTELATVELPFAAEDSFSIEVSGTDLFYDNSDVYGISKRPVARGDVFEKDPAAFKLAVAEENFKYRRLDVAEKNYKDFLQQTPYSIQALSRLAEICIRTNRGKEAGKLLTEALKIDTYDGYANFLFGVWSMEQDDYNSAEEALAIASRTREWKVSAYIEMAKLHLSRGQYQKAVDKCNTALKYDEDNLNTLRLLALAAKGVKDVVMYQQALKHISHIDPLNMFVLLENEFGINNGNWKQVPQELLHNEFAWEIMLEQAIYYQSLGFLNEAIILFKENRNSPLAFYWLAYLDKANAQRYLDEANGKDVLFVFPHEEETYKVLDEASKHSSSWKILYYKALYQWMWNNKEEAAALFALCGNPDTPDFYSIRGAFFNANGEYEKAIQEYRRHLAMDKNDWRVYHRLATQLKGKERLAETLNFAKEGMAKFKDQFMLKYDYANLLIVAGKYKESLEVMRQMVVLPAEHTGSAYPLFCAANLLQALEEMGKNGNQKVITYIDDSKQWPANLGGGFGYTTDFRLQDMLIAHLRGENITDCLRQYIDQRLSEGNTGKHLQSWLIAYKNKEEYTMQHSATLMENERYTSCVVTADYVCLRVLQKLISD